MNTDIRVKLAKGARKLARLIRRGQANLITGTFVDRSANNENCGPGCAGGFIAAAAGFDPLETQSVFREARVGLDRVVLSNDRLDMKKLLTRLDEINHRFLK